MTESRMRNADIVLGIPYAIAVALGFAYVIARVAGWL